MVRAEADPLPTVTLLLRPDRSFVVSRGFWMTVQPLEFD
ncbi:hypothetical protein FHS85_005347, partial [Rhodoligotrophos appendicifer]